MPATRRSKPLYQRGPFKLYPRAGRALEIVWYDEQRKRERSRSAGTACPREGREAVDRLYLEQTGGDAFCPTCGQARAAGGVLVVTAIADYLTMAKDKASFGAIRPRLDHVMNFMMAKGLTGTRCDQVDDGWIGRFRAWAKEQPIVSPTGKTRQRTLSTVENSVLQLRAAIAAFGGTTPRFEVIQIKKLNRTPQHRSDVAELIRMFRYCLYPQARSAKEVERRRRERLNLLSFLRISVATWARPDAAHDVSTAPERKQWSSQHQVLNLNPAGREQTRKYRATVPIARQVAPWLDSIVGNAIPIETVKGAWEKMAAELGLPGEGEGGMKLIRRSMAHIARQRLPEEAWGEVTMFLGHDSFDSVSDVYAPFSPTYLRRVLKVVEDVVDDIEKGCPGAFYRAVTAGETKVVAIAGGKK